MPPFIYREDEATDGTNRQKMTDLVVINTAEMHLMLLTCARSILTLRGPTANPCWFGEIYRN